MQARAQDSPPAEAKDEPSVHKPSIHEPSIHEPSIHEPSREPSILVGMTLSDMFAKYGAPQTVYVSRGVETWQDDAVFVYPAPYGGIECYVFKDRVWQVGVKSALGVKVGDSRTAAALVLGENRQDFDNCALYPLAPKAWPLTLRLNFDVNGKIQAIFIYRPDF
jgi:hypothetical protein